MKKYLPVILVALVIIPILALAAEKKISRAGQNTMINQGGTNTTSGMTVVVSDSNTNEMRISAITAVVTGSDTAYTNTFDQPYLATPIIIRGAINGGSNVGVMNTVTSTVTTTSLIVVGMSTTVTNNIPFIIYGYKNTGVFQ